MKVSIVGVTGYSGLELVKILQNHNHVEVASIHASQDIGQKLSEVYPHLLGICDLPIQAFDSQTIMAVSDLVFFATPSGLASQMVAEFVEADFPVIDLSGDHRLPADIYEQWYQKKSAPQSILDCFVYGLSEFADLAGQKFIANPGCYATATELALIPLAQAGLLDGDGIVIDAKSGLSGAGKALANSSHFVNVHDNYVTYKLNQHQHIPEIVQTLQQFDSKMQQLQFSTSLLPVNRGIMVSCYVKLNQSVIFADILDLYQQAYAQKPFVRLQKNLPNLHQVVGSNFTDIGLAYNETTGILTVVAVIDNLIKGAAGQAVQNLNLMMGFEESEGLKLVPNYL